MKTLIACTTCHGEAFRVKAASQLLTWGKSVCGADLKFFCGRSEDGRKPYSYEEKMLAIFRWALDHGYEYVWKIDDDVYLRPERLLAVKPFDYCGMVVDLNYYDDGVYVTRARAALGGIYGLSKRSLECLTAPDTRPDFALFEDGWVSLQLKAFGIVPEPINHVVGYTHVKGEDIKNLFCCAKIADIKNTLPPTPLNNVIAGFEYDQFQMMRLHALFTGESTLNEAVVRWGCF
jgi:hypothetical protein